MLEACNDRRVIAPKDFANLLQREFELLPAQVYSDMSGAHDAPFMGFAEQVFRFDAVMGGDHADDFIGSQDMFCFFAQKVLEQPLGGFYCGGGFGAQREGL